MSNETLSTKIALLEQNSKSNETTHQQMAMDIKELKQDNKEIKESVQAIELSIAELPKTLSDEFDKRYASKDYEDGLKKLNWLVISAVVLALLGIVIKVV